jgi:hypothetical protein
MNETEILELIESVNLRRTDGSASPVHTSAAHAQLVEDFNKLVAAGYELGSNDVWTKKH